MSLPKDQPGHGQMSCNPEAHDYLGFGDQPSHRAPMHDPRQSSSTEQPAKTQLVFRTRRTGSP